MSTITGPDGAGGALPPVAKTITQLIKELGGSLSDFTEVDGAKLAANSVVYLVSQDSITKNCKVILKATADAEGNNPLRAVPKDVFQSPTYVGGKVVTITNKTVATQKGTGAAIVVSAATTFTGVTITPASSSGHSAGDVVTFTAKAEAGYNINGSKLKETFNYKVS